MPAQTTKPSGAQSAQWLTDALVSARLFDPLQLSPYLAEFRSSAGPGTAAALAAFLVEAGLLTTYQAERALAGQANRLALGPYILVEPIGTGSLGTVYLAINRSDRKRYAVKVLPLRSLWNVHLAKQQVQVFQALPPHPAVVPFVDVDSAGGSHYLAWPYVRGQTLADIVRSRGPRPTDQVLRIAAQIAEGLLLCHTHDLSHGLIKPSNLLIGTDNQARMLDLGIGAILSENIADDESMLDTISTANAAMGLLDYAAPETLDAPTLRTPAGDIYSFGCTLYFLLTGGMPFPEGNAVDKILAHQTQKARSIREINNTVPAWLERLTEQMMAKVADERPATADVLAALLAGDYTLPLPTSPRTSPSSDESDSLAKTRPTPWLLNLQPRTPVTEPPALSESPSSERTESSLAVAEARPPSDPTDPLLISDPTPAPARVPIFTPSPSRYHLKSLADSRSDDQSTTETLPLPPAAAATPDVVSDERRPITVPVLPPFARSIWWRLGRRLSFWKPHADVVQLTIFGPHAIRPGDNVVLQVFAHTPEAFESVQTLAKVFQRNGEPLATGFVQREVTHGQRLGLHLGVVSASVDRSEVELTWRGQPQPRKFDLYVPWESPAGPSPTVLSAGLDRVLSGRIAFTLHILPRKA